MLVRRLDHLNLTVADLDQSIEWYGRVFGFEVAERGMYEGEPWAILRSGNALLCMYQRPGAEAPGDGPQHHLNHFGLEIEDRKKWEAIVEKEKIEVAYGGAVEWPHSTAWYVEDPTGYEIEVALWNNGEPTFG